MKRLIVVAVLTVAVLYGMLHFMPQSMYSDVLNYDCNAQITVYCRNTDLSGVDTGLGRMVTCSVDDYYYTLRNCSGIDGLSVRFNGDMRDVSKTVARLKAEIVSVQRLGDLYVACLYSPRLQGGVTVDGKLVNAQVAYSCGTVTVGYPFILGEY